MFHYAYFRGFGQSLWPRPLCGEGLSQSRVSGFRVWGFLRIKGIETRSVGRSNLFLRLYRGLVFGWGVEVYRAVVVAAGAVFWSHFCTAVLESVTRNTIVFHGDCFRGYRAIAVAAGAAAFVRGEGQL